MTTAKQVVDKIEQYDKQTDDYISSIVREKYEFWSHNEYVHVGVTDLDMNHFALISHMKQEGFAITNICFDDSEIIFG